MAGDERRFPLSADAESVGQARRHAVTTLESWDLDHLRDDIELLTSELVTNAVLHARTPCELVMAVSKSSVRIEVHDASKVLPMTKMFGETATTGRGLTLVGVLGQTWGAEKRPEGKIVWVEIDRHRSHQGDDDSRQESPHAPQVDVDDLDALEAALLGDAGTAGSDEDDASTRSVATPPRDPR